MSSDPNSTNPANQPAAPGPAHAPDQPATSTPKTPPVAPRSTDEITVIRHSNLFYWWPVWAIGFAFALVSYFDNQHLAIVPANTIAAKQREVDVDGSGKKETRDVLILDAKHKVRTRFNEDTKEHEPIQPTIYVTRFKTLGTIYAVVLLLVITITNISIRGLWTVFVFVVIIMLAIIIGISGWLESILHRLNQLSIYINLGGYILISSVLLVLWLFNLLFFDRQTYMVFTPGQVRVRLEIGGEETVYDTTGMVIQRERGDLFRHWVLGFGSGDLIIKPVGLSNPLLFPNVLRVESVVEKIERMMKEKVIVKSPQPKNPSA